MSSPAQPSNRKFYLLVAAFLLAAVLMGVLTASRSGPTELERLKAELRAKGEKLTLDELMAGTVSTNRASSRAADMERIVKALRARSLRVENLEVLHHLGDGSVEPVWSRTNLLTTAGKSSPGSTHEWSALKEDLAAVETEMAEALALVAVPDMDAGLNYDISSSVYEHRSTKNYLIRWLAALHALHLRDGRHADARLALDAATQLVAWHRDELTVEDQRSRIALATVALNLTWSTMQSKVLSDERLKELLDRWQALGMADQFLRALEVERAIGQRAFAVAHERGVSELLGASERVLEPLWRMTANRDEEFFLRQFQAILDMARNGARAMSFGQVKTQLAAKDAELGALLSSWRRVEFLVTGMTRVGYAANERIQQGFHRYETHRSMSLAALALELHRRKHGRHPDSLEQLMPELLPSVPVDWMDGKPIRYRLNPDGTFTLWSVGDNLTDDGSDASGAPVNMRRNTIWEGRDAVWPRLPP